MAQRRENRARVSHGRGRYGPRRAAGSHMHQAVNERANSTPQAAAARAAASAGRYGSGFMGWIGLRRE